MKHGKLTLVFLTCTAGSAFAQGGAPNCVATNFDQGRNLFTIVNATPGAFNQQCFLTVLPAPPAGSRSADNLAGRFIEGKYEIVLSGGGGGGGGGSSEEGGGGGGGGALPARTIQYLSPGVYRLTIGKGGDGGAACLTAKSGGRAGEGNPTSVSEAYSGVTIAGYPRAEYWAGRPAERYTVASSRGIPAQGTAGNDGSGGQGVGGQSNGGNGGHTERGEDHRASDGTPLMGASWGGIPGKGGNRMDSEMSRVTFAGGGGGGAGFGNGGDGQALGRVTVAAQPGDLGAGGGGGAGGEGTCGEGAKGGDGFVKLSLLEPAPQAAAPAPAREVVIVQEPPRIIALAPPSVRKFSLSADALFQFNSSTLTGAGRSALDDLANKIGTVDVERIIDTGHADRIGSSEYNQKLSEARAQAVMRYLVSKGFPSERIVAEGKGETQPVTSPEDCKGPKSAKLIACLQPDRRVDLEVVGTARQ